MKIPAKYQWLLNEPAPKVLVEALKHYGTLEKLGAGSNPDISRWAKEIGVEKDYTDDAIPWCGLFVAVCVKRTGSPIVSKPLWARNWLFYGRATEIPMLGDVMVFKRGSGGHVAFYVGETEDAYAVLGGNQSDSVCITLIHKTRLLQARRKAYQVQPENVRVIHLTDSGELSQNEA